jgi:hypothetical protein
VSFRSLVRRRAAKEYARRLPGTLLQGYGATQFHTAAQIEAPVGKARQPPKYITIGYAAFPPEDAFRQLTANGDYKFLRAPFKRYLTTAPAYGIDPLDREYPGVTSGFG